MKQYDRNTTRSTNYNTSNRQTGISILFAISIVLFLYITKGYAPFGTLSLATNDANNQYIDFFLYFKDVLEGKNSISYSFSKLLGGTNIALFSYYLASPLNLLIVLFKKEQVLVFYHLLVLLKILFGTVTFSVFLNARFPHKAGVERFSDHDMV